VIDVLMANAAADGMPLIPGIPPESTSSDGRQPSFTPETARGLLGRIGRHVT